jgi:excisionase family DNA binding protein
MNKKEAIAYLGVSERALARYVEQGHISVRYINGKNGKEARYDEKELARFKADRDTPTHRPGRPELEEPSALPAMPSPASMAAVVEAIAPLFQRLAIAEPKKRALLLTEIAAKPLLRVDEASSLTGLSRSRLRAAIEKEELPAFKDGRSWRIHRPALDSFIEALASASRKNP